jgi:hypothetical protein
LLGNRSMKPITTGSLLVVHGLAHAAAGMAAQDAPRGLALLLAPTSRIVLATTLFAIALPGFVAAGFGCWRVIGLERFWRVLARVAAVASGLLLVTFARPLIETTLGLALDAVAWSLTFQHPSLTIQHAARRVGGAT